MMSLFRSRSWTALLAMLLAACSSDAVAPAPPVLSIASGDAQSAFVMTELHERVVVQLRDGKQRPVAAAKITWARVASPHDRILSMDSVTNAAGEARARWQLDSAVGQHIISVSATGAATVSVHAYGTARPPSAVAALPVETYDGSGEAVHPDFVRLPPSWAGDPFRLLATPYPGGDQTFENPSIFTGSTGTSWTIPASIHNPLETVRGGYLSDPDAVYDPDANEIRIYYRHVLSENEIWLIRSSDGVSWTIPVLVVHAPSHMVVSPSVVRRSQTDWLMWSVNAGVEGCGGASTVVELRTSTDGVSWSAPEPTILNESDGYPWHIDVEWIPARGEYWAVYPIKRAGSCATDRLRFATSADGVTWKTFASPVLLKGASDQLRDIIYRSAIDYDATTGTVSIWYSGASIVDDGSAFSWHLAWERMSVSALIARVSAPMPAEARLGQSPNTLQLTNESAP